MKKEDVGYLIKLISDRMRTQADADLREYDLTFSQARILGYLHRWGPEATQKEIGTYLDVAHPTVVGLVSRLEKNGFVECRTDSRDRRNKIVCLALKAYETKEKVDEKRKQYERVMTAGFSEAERHELIRLLGKVYSNYEGGDL